MVPLYAPRFVTASTIRNSDVATKNVPTTDWPKPRVMTTVRHRVAAAEMTAPNRLTMPPRATLVSPGEPLRLRRAGPR